MRALSFLIIYIFLGILTPLSSQEISKTQFREIVKGPSIVGLSPQGFAAFIEQSSGTTEPVGGCRMTLVIRELSTTRVKASLNLLEPGQGDIPTSGHRFEKGLWLLKKYKIEPISLLEAPVPEDAKEQGVISVRMTPDGRYLLLEHYQDEGMTLAEIAEREWAYWFTIEKISPDFAP